MNSTSTPDPSPRLSLVIATAGGLGLLRPAPGTWGSLGAAAAGAAWILLAPTHLLSAGLAGGVIAATVAGIPAAGRAARHFGREDPSQVVIDEVAGQWLAMALIPATVLVASPASAIILSFVAFRAFDIIKPWPISWLERLPGGWGIMADDLAAGLCAGLLTTALTA